jgi:DNA-binding transcriptional LysR family regulator
VSVTAPNDLGRFMAAFAKDFRAAYPGVGVDLLLTNRYVDLVGEGVDVAVRAGALSDSSLVAKRVATTRRALFASPRYLAQHGTPKQPSDLAAHACVLFAASKGERWAMRRGKQQAEVKVEGPVSADDIVALKELAVHGLGVAFVPTFVCRDDVKAKRLVHVLTEWSSEPSPIGVVYPAQKFQHPKVRAFVDAIAPALTETFGSVDQDCGVEA